MLNHPGGPFIKHHLKLKYTPGFRFSFFAHSLPLYILPLGVGHPSFLAVLTQNSWWFKCFFSGIQVSSLSSDLGGRCFMDLTWESPQQAWLLDRQANGWKEWREEGEGWRRVGVGMKGGVWKHRTGEAAASAPHPPVPWLWGRVSSARQHRCCCIVWSSNPTGSKLSLAIVFHSP